MLDNRSRGQSFRGLLYDDSCNPNYLKILKTMYLCNIQVSPLHDMDKDSDGHFKKPHRHILIQFPNPITMSAWEEYRTTLGIVCPPDPRVPANKINNERAYQLHLSQKAIRDKKHIYNIDDVIFYGEDWFKEELQDIVDLISASSVSDTQMICEMIDWCVAHRCDSYFNLFRYSRDHNRAWLEFLVQSGKASVIIGLLKSYHYNICQ